VAETEKKADESPTRILWNTVRQVALVAALVLFWSFLAWLAAGGTIRFE
jgi:hypothetical protein